MARKAREKKINGKWLVEALEAQGETITSAAKRAGIDSHHLFNHKHGRSTISTGVLFILCSALPTLSERYVLTGRGPRLLASSEIDNELFVESLQIKQSIDRILEKLTN